MSDSISFPVDDKYITQLQDIINESNSNIYSDIEKLKEHQFLVAEQEIETDLPYAPEHVSNLVGFHLRSDIMANNLSYKFYYHQLIKLAEKYGKKGKTKFYSEKVPYLYHDDKKLFILPNEVVDNILASATEQKLSNIPVIKKDVFHKKDLKKFGTNLVLKGIYYFENKQMEKVKKIIKP